MTYPQPSPINITITPCTEPSIANSSLNRPEDAHPLEQQAPDDERANLNYPENLAKRQPPAAYNNAVTRDYDIGQSTMVHPNSPPHRQIRHAKPLKCIGKSHKNREKIQKFKANRVGPAIRQDVRQNEKRKHDEYLPQDGYFGPQGRRKTESEDGQHYLNEHQNSYGDDEYLATGRQLEMYRTRSFMSQLSYERGIDDYGKYGGYGNGGDGYGSAIFRVDSELEAKIVRKLDRNLLPLLGILYLFSYLDRVNIGNARLFGLEEDVKMSDGQYNMGSISFGLAWVTSFKGLVIARFALGAAEAGALGGLLAAGISHLSGKLGLQGWQWIFILEAIPTVLLAVLTWIVMSPSPEKARFLTPEERIYATNRVMIDTDIKPTPRSSMKQTFAAMTDYRVYLICLCYFFLQFSSSGVIMFMPSLIADMGFKATSAQLLTTPVYLVAAIVSLLIPWWSDRIQVRGVFVIFMPFLAILGFVLLAVSPWFWLKYMACMFALSGMIPTGSILTSWLTNNVIGHTKRATALAMLVSSGSLAAMAGTQVYRAGDAPRYQHGHLIMACSILLLVLTATLLRTLLVRENRCRDRNVSKGLTLIQFMSDGQFSEVGDHPNFRYTI
ncbi:hypothetical protein BGZ46_010691 [Entomortierella lignicola]|nr:hypothetical protein BGZ46_010691 [Entomortierella lignicola]